MADELEFPDRLLIAVTFFEHSQALMAFSMMAESEIYVLKGYGQIDPAWVKDCLKLFKDRRVNIRKLFLMRANDPAFFSMLEIQFALSEEAAREPAFLKMLEERLAALEGSEKMLLPA